MKNTNVLGLKILSFVLVLMVAFGSFSAVSLAEDGGESEEFVFENLLLYNNAGNDLTLLGFYDLDLANEILTIPSAVNNKKIVAIVDEAFAGLGFLTKVEIPATINWIGDRAFSDCSSLEAVVFEGDVSYIGEDAFKGTTWYDNYPEDYIYADSGRKHLIGYKGESKDLVLHHTTEKIAAGVFANNDNIESILIPERVTYIGDRAFYNSPNLADITIRGNLEHCGIEAFDGTDWLLNFNSEFVFIGDLLLKYNGDDSTVVMPSAFKKIATGAFMGKDNVLTVVLPASVENIAPNAFDLYDDGENIKKAEIYCYKNTYAHNYALENGYEVREFLHMMGDFNNDGKITAADARSYLRIAAKILVYEDSRSPLMIAGDVNSDGKITSSDARVILRIAAKLEYYDSELLQSKPNTAFDVLLAYSQALRAASTNEVGFSLLQHQKMDHYNLNINSRTYLMEFEKGLTAEKKAKVKKIAPGDVDKLSSLYLYDFTNSGIIKTADCTVNSDKKYVFEITLKDEKAEFGEKSFTNMLFPVDSKDDFQKILKSRWWYDLYAKDGKLTYDITYTNCTLKAVVDIQTGRIESVDMHMEYKITDIAGKLGGIKITDGNGKANGNALRVDTVKYSDFVYDYGLSE